MVTNKLDKILNSLPPDRRELIKERARQINDARTAARLEEEAWTAELRTVMSGFDENTAASLLQIIDLVESRQARLCVIPANEAAGLLRITRDRNGFRVQPYDDSPRVEGWDDVPDVGLEKLDP